ncbi:C2H2-type zinc finger protein [Cardinium endosymbiont of Sogatella furcifera]|uniref:C2H2-type zinc finger protein n=1 Tax=Cardinium endosymbiont of Sogatella furcifera TaxID=650378 RepID=UPI000E0D2A03|nr:C2H2-type zinc finger protein [Cardinium endosymbiont of Sogatella furcifera]AXI23961.1 C2H2-type zinc finger protein [Cardinium endosymbiont of Sogatella furcifera]
MYQHVNVVKNKFCSKNLYYFFIVYYLLLVCSIYGCSAQQVNNVRVELTSKYCNYNVDPIRIEDSTNHKTHEFDHSQIEYVVVEKRLTINNDLRNIRDKYKIFCRNGSSLDGVMLNLDPDKAMSVESTLELLKSKCPPNLILECMLCILSESDKVLQGLAISDIDRDTPKECNICKKLTSLCTSVERFQNSCLYFCKLITADHPESDSRHIEVQSSYGDAPEAYPDYGDETDSDYLEHNDDETASKVDERTPPRIGVKKKSSSQLHNSSPRKSYSLRSKSSNKRSELVDIKTLKVKKGNRKIHSAPSKSLGRKKTSRNKAGEYKCGYNDCYKQFTHKWKLDRHKKFHDEERNWKCDQCDQKFKTEGHLKEHIKRHNPTKTLKCKHCEKNFKVESDLIRHQKIHNTKNTYSCSVNGCSYKTNVQRYLKVHIKGHENREWK